MRAKNHINSFLIEHGTHISHLQISIREKKKQNWGSSLLIHDQLHLISIVSQKERKYMHKLLQIGKLHNPTIRIQNLYKSFIMRMNK